MSPDLARNVLVGIAWLLLGTALAAVLLRQLMSGVRLLVLQGLLLAAAAVVLAFMAPSPHTVLAVLLTLAVKAIAVPAILAVAVGRVPIKQEVESVLPRNALVVCALIIVFVAYHATRPFAAVGLLPDGQGLSVAGSLLLLGLFAMITRKKAISQVVGLVLMENGVYFAALVMTTGLPVAVEMAVAADLLLAIVVFSRLTDRIQQTFATINTDLLRVLRG